MKYGYFDDARREYVIDRADVPVSWTNYIGLKDLCAVVSHTAGGYMFYKTPQYHRITRFRPNGVPMDRPGFYLYLRDDETGEYWSITWQPTGGDLAHYECRHGLSYSTYACKAHDITASQTIFIPLDDDVMLWDVKIKSGDRQRKLSVYSYVEFSYHHIEMDNQNFQMSLYCSGSSYQDGVIEYNLFYEHAYQYMTASFGGADHLLGADHLPDGFDCLRDAFIGTYRSETNPLAVERGACFGSQELTGNHCGVLMKHLTLEPGEEQRLVFMLGEGDRAEGLRIRRKYGDFARVDDAFAQLREYWNQTLSVLQVQTPHAGMNSSLNIWNLYQAETNVNFSRFSSFVEVGGRTGLGYRDTAQDAMSVPHSEKCRMRIEQLLVGETQAGYGIHLFEPSWFSGEVVKPAFKSPTIIHVPDKSSVIHGPEEACSDDALWLVSAVVEYIRETGDFGFINKVYPYADGGEGTVYEHLTKILDFSAQQVGESGICKGLRADWNDCLNLGGGESALVSFLHYWAIEQFLTLLRVIDISARDVTKYEEMAARVKTACEGLWDGRWYIRGITSEGRRIGTNTDAEGKVHMESNTWAVVSGAADQAHGLSAMDAVDEYLYSEYGLHLNAPAYSAPDDTIGYITRVYKGVKENGAIFSHPNPWAWIAEARLGRGSRAMKFYDALLPYNQNDQIEIRKAEPYSYCQFVMGRDHTSFGRANHPWMTGSAGWAYFAATRFMLGIRPDFNGLTVDPCIPADWPGFSATRRFRGAEYRIQVENPDGVEKGVKSILLNGKPVTNPLPPQAEGSVNDVKVILG